jgi:hypothetical protein
MDTTLLIGLAVVGLGTALGALMMFGQRSNSLAETGVVSGTIPASSAGTARELSAPSARRELPEEMRPPVPRGLRSANVRIPWHQRLRSGLVLVLITVGLGMAVGAVLGAAAMAITLLIG